MDIAFLILNIVAVVASPIAAVIIAQRLQNRAAKRKDKIDIFKTLVSTNAFGWGGNYHAVEVINSIPVIFADNENVVRLILDTSVRARLMQKKYQLVSVMQSKRQK